MTRRKVTAREFLFLAGEVQSWKDQGLVSPERGDAILKNYEIEESRVRHVGLLTLTGLGVFLLGLSVLLLVRQSKKGRNMSFMSCSDLKGVGIKSFLSKNGSDVLSLCSRVEMRQVVKISLWTTIFQAKKI